MTTKEEDQKIKDLKEKNQEKKEPTLEENIKKMKEKYLNKSGKLAKQTPAAAIRQEFTGGQNQAQPQTANQGIMSSIGNAISGAASAVGNAITSPSAFETQVSNSASRASGANMQKTDKMEKALSDNTLSLIEKIKARQARNVRDVKETKTPSGQDTRTARSGARRESALESGAERRPGEKIVGTPKRIPEHEAGVHMHSGSFVPGAPVGGGPNSSAPVSAKGDIKSYVVGGHAQQPSFSGKGPRAHDDVMQALHSFKAKHFPHLVKSEELEKPIEGQEARNPHSVCASTLKKCMDTLRKGNKSEWEPWMDGAN